MFRKYASVKSLGTASYSSETGFSRVAFKGDTENLAKSVYIDGSRKIDVKGILSRAASKFDLSADPSDYIFEAIRANTTNVPNDNHDGFHKNELLRFDTRVGKPVYMTYVEKPHHVNHKTDIPKRARGVIVDAHYNDETPALNVCPHNKCASDTSTPEGRDASGLHCKKCGSLIKDEFVEILVAVDSKKDPEFADGVKNGFLRAGSMGCFLPGTQITMADGTRTAIENVREGDRIITHRGNIAEVAETSVHEHEDDVFQVEIQGLLAPVTATGNHPFWVVNAETSDGAWVDADKLTEGQYLRCPATAEPTQKIENDFARLVGYFVSEGNYIKAYDGPHTGERVGLEFSFSIHEKEYVAEVVALLHKYGNKPSVYDRPARNITVVKDYRCIDLTNRMYRLVGQHAVDKTLSSEILAWPREAQLHFIGTWLNGDGNSIHDGGHSWSTITTSSINLRDQLSQMLVNLGIPHRLQAQVSGFGGRLATNIIISGNPQLELKPYSDKIKRPHALVSKTATIADSHGLLRKIKSIKTETYTGPVYNFEVKHDDHSYVAGGVAVHNCSCQSTICNVCSHIAYSTSEFCQHIRQGNKGTLWIKSAQKGWRRIEKREAAKLMKERGYDYVPQDFCFFTEPTQDGGKNASADAFEIRKAFEYCLGVEFEEYSRVDQPADPKALQRAILKAAGAEESLQDETKRLLLQRKNAGMSNKKNADIESMNVDADLFEDAAIHVDTPTGDHLEAPDGSQVQTGPDNMMDEQEMQMMQQPGMDGMMPPGAPNSIDQLQQQQQDPNAQVSPEEMGVAPEGIMPPGASKMGNKFEQDYSEFAVKITKDCNASLISPAGSIMTIEGSKKNMSDDERRAFGQEIIDSLLSAGIVRTALKYKGTFTKKFADVTDMAIDDMLEERAQMPSVLSESGDDMRQVIRDKKIPSEVTKEYADDMKDVRPKTPKSVIDSRDVDLKDILKTTTTEQLSSVKENDNNDLRNEEHKKFTMTKSDVTKDGDNDRRAAAKMKVCAECDKEPCVCDSKKEAALVEARLRKLNAAKVEKIQKEADKRVQDEIAKFAKALKIASKRMALNLEESPLKAALHDVLSDDSQHRKVGEDIASGESLFYAPMDRALAAHLIESAWDAGAGREIDALVKNASELMKSGEAYLKDAEKDLAKQAAFIPQLTQSLEASSQSIEDVESASTRKQALRGNLTLSSMPEVDIDDGVGAKTAVLRDALRGTKTNIILDQIRPV